MQFFSAFRVLIGMRIIGINLGESKLISDLQGSNMA